MTSQEIYKDKNNITIKKSELNKQLNIVKSELIALENNCPHELILIFDDHLPHLIGKILRCKCPACGKFEDVNFAHKFE